MKKNYEKPTLICEDLKPESLLCACSFNNPNLSEAMQCGFEPDGLGFRIFAQAWADCMLEDTSIYCYQNGTINLFGS